jgi:hypothetical protein
MARAVPKAVDAIAKAEGTYGTAEHELQRERAHRTSELARREVDSGFHLIFSFATVALWSLLESMLRDVVVSRLKNDPKAFQGEALGRLRIRLGEYEQLAQEDRYHHVAELLEADLAAGLRNGVDRFEVMLRPFALDGPVPGPLRRDTFEFGQVRNAFVHQGWKADHQLSKACPWLGLVVGQELPLGRDHFERYLRASHHYVILLTCRVGEQFGKDMEEERKAVFSEYGSTDEPPQLILGR